MKSIIFHLARQIIIYTIVFFFFFNDTATTEIYTLSLHDALPIYAEMASGSGRDVAALMRAVPGLLAKDGFEGVEVAALPDGRAVAVKIADGANRARIPVAAAALARAGVDPAALTEFRGEALLGGGQPVGCVRPARSLDPVVVPACA